MKHIKIEKEIGREKILAEYFETPITFLNKKYKKISDIWDIITAPFYIARRKIKDAYWEIRYGFERMFKDYDSVDTFETYAKFIERYTKILSEFKKYHMGYPGTLTNDEWENILDEMIYHLYYMDETNVNKELSKDVSENLIPTLITSHEIMEKHKNEFFKLFSEYFFNLWD